MIQTEMPTLEDAVAEVSKMPYAGGVEARWNPYLSKWRVRISFSNGSTHEGTSAWLRNATRQALSSMRETQ